VAGGSFDFSIKKTWQRARCDRYRQCEEVVPRPLTAGVVQIVANLLDPGQAL